MALQQALDLWRAELSTVDSDEEFRASHRRSPSGLQPADWLTLASMYVALRDVGRVDWADCIDKAVLLRCHSLYLVGRQSEFFWWGGTKRYTWTDFLDQNGRFRDASGLLRKNRVRSAAHTSSAFVPSTQAKNFRFFAANGSLLSTNVYTWASYREAGRKLALGESSGVLAATPNHGRDPFALPLRPGDVLVFDYRWHGSAGYSGHVPTVCYFDPEEGLLGIVEDHLPSGGGKVASVSDAWLFARDGRWQYVPGFNPKGGRNAFSGMSTFGRGGPFGDPSQPLSGAAFDPARNTLVASPGGAPEAERRHWLGRNWAGFLGFARYACVP